MKIVNKEFHDYYDGCMGHGIDKTIIYDRKQSIYNHYSKEYELSKKFLKSFNKGFYNPGYLDEDFFKNKVHYWFTNGYIAFCGKIISFIKCERSLTNECNLKNNELYFYDASTFLSYLKNIKYEVRKYYRNKFEENFIHEYFKTIDETEIFFEFKNPVFSNIHAKKCLKYNRKLIINPKLEDYQFYGVYDAYSCFQEISMFLSGVLGEHHPPIEEICDEIRKHKHGFGHKYAFKKEPENFKKYEENNGIINKL